MTGNGGPLNHLFSFCFNVTIVTKKIVYTQGAADTILVAAVVLQETNVQ